jgi:Tfp pilus assembly protein PilN
VIPINLAPPLQRPRRRLAPLCVTAAGMAVLSAISAWYALAVRAETRLGSQVAALTTELTALQVAVAQGTAAREAMRDLANRAQAIQELERGQGATLRALDAILDVVPPDLFLNALESRATEWRAAGWAASPPAVAAFTANLRTSGQFRDVDIAVARQDLGKTPAGPVTFEVTGRFVP